MSASQPFFSVVIPTTRPHYLQFSLASVLAQTFADFEVIVAFNPVSESATLDTVPLDPRVKVITAERLLPMHENWERGFRGATGQWVMFWRWGGFIDKSWPTEERNTAQIPPFSGNLMCRNSAEVSDLVYGLNPRKMGEMKTWLPSIMRGAVRNGIVRRAQERSGTFCHPLTPDYGAAAQILTLTDAIHLLDLPLVILNHTGDSMAASAQAGSEKVKAAQFYGVSGNPVFRYAPVQTRLESNRPVIYETIMIINEKYGASTSVDVEKFLVWHYSGLLGAHASGTDISSAEAEIDRVVQTLPLDKQREVRRKFEELAVQPPHSANSTWRQAVFAWLDRALMTFPVPRVLFRGYVKRRGLRIDTAVTGVDSIFKFSRIVSPLISR
jgi:Glycosyl transferase family 2